MDAKVIDRDAMMKFDIAKNDEGPLRRTMQSSSLKKGQEDISSVSGGKSAEWDTSSLGGLDERMKNLEEHLAIRYGKAFDSVYYSGCLMLAQSPPRP